MSINPFKEIDEAKDIESSARAALEARERKLLNKAAICSYRTHVSAMYHPGKCLHPARENAKGGGTRMCLGTECPIIQGD